MTHKRGYHYTESGLDNIWLINGYETTETPYGPSTAIHDVDGLHAVIGTKLSEQKETLSAAEVRFLRHELDTSQRLLGDLLGVGEQTVARWEKPNGKHKITGPAQKLLGALFRESIADDSKLREKLELLAELDAEFHESMSLVVTEEDTWIACAA